jgi:hypothetical protein
MLFNSNPIVSIVIVLLDSFMTPEKVVSSGVILKEVILLSELLTITLYITSFPFSAVTVYCIF